MSVLRDKADGAALSIAALSIAPGPEARGVRFVCGSKPVAIRELAPYVDCARDPQKTSVLRASVSAGVDKRIGRNDPSVLPPRAHLQDDIRVRLPGVIR